MKIKDRKKVIEQNRKALKNDELLIKLLKERLLNEKKVK